MRSRPQVALFWVAEMLTTPSSSTNATRGSASRRASALSSARATNPRNTLLYECSTSSRCERAIAVATSATWGALPIAAVSLASEAVSSFRTTMYCPWTGFSARCRLERSSVANADIDMDMARIAAAPSAVTLIGLLVATFICSLPTIEVKTAGIPRTQLSQRLAGSRLRPRSSARPAAAVRTSRTPGHVVPSVPGPPDRGVRPERLSAVADATRPPCTGALLVPASHLPPRSPPAGAGKRWTATLDHHPVRSHGDVLGSKPPRDLRQEIKNLSKSGINVTGIDFRAFQSRPPSVRNHNATPARTRGRAFRCSIVGAWRRKAT